jgi:uncharacterized protein YdeI (YjbR/CyaY-like superfamily)
MKMIYIRNRGEWRHWLGHNHDKEKKGIWLVFYKKGSGQSSLDYEDAVEEALCFGWIDSIIKKIDTEKYVRKFTPRKIDSRWSELNKKRAAKAMKEGKMTQHGLLKMEVAKKSGLWDKDGRPKMNMKIQEEFAYALKKNKKAEEFYNKLAPSYKKHFIGWIQSAKQPQTKNRRIKESIDLLVQGKKLGLK